MTKKTALSIITALMLLPIAASSATLGVIGGAGSLLPSNFDLKSSISGVSLSDEIAVFSGSAGRGLVLDRKASVNFTFVGKEAGALNSAFLGAGGPSLSNRDTVGASMSGIFEAGLIDFGFDTINNGSLLTILNGGTSQVGALSLAFSRVFNRGQSVYAFFGDGRGDSDFDDMVLRIN
jgi:hypothetical protein